MVYNILQQRMLISSYFTFISFLWAIIIDYSFLHKKDKIIFHSIQLFDFDVCT